MADHVTDVVQANSKKQRAYEFLIMICFGPYLKAGELELAGIKRIKPKLLMLVM